MIGHLRGAILEKSPNLLVVEASGVGYDVQIPISTFTAVGEVGSTVALRIFTHVREDALLLFGFSTREEKLLFEKLISVSGIGPKLGITILSGLATAELVRAIRSGDIARLVRIPGVGKKTAERLVLELKDKVAAIEAEALKDPSHAAEAVGLSALDHDVLSALLNLGCARLAAEEALRKARLHGAAETFEPLFRASLALLR